MEHAKEHAPQYGETSALTYHEAKQLTAKQDSMFRDLPSSTRKRFNHDVEEFLTFLENPANAEDITDDGIINSSSSSTPAESNTTTETLAPEGDITP